MNCPKCNNHDYVKDGIIKGKQRYRCKQCGYRYTVESRSTERSIDDKRKALELYLEGLGFRSIGRILKVSHVAVYYWIKAFGEKVVGIRKDKLPAVVTEMDEMHSYIGSKKNIAGSGLLLIDLQRNSSIVLLDQEEQRLVSNCGNQ